MTCGSPTQQWLLTQSEYCTMPGSRLVWVISSLAAGLGDFSGSSSPAWISFWSHLLPPSPLDKGVLHQTLRFFFIHATAPLRFLFQTNFSSLFPEKLRRFPRPLNLNLVPLVDRLSEPWSIFPLQDSHIFAVLSICK